MGVKRREGRGGGCILLKKEGILKRGDEKRKGDWYTFPHYGEYQEVRNFSSSENLVYVINEWSPTLDFVSFKVKKLLGIAAKFAFDIKDI